MTLVFKIKHDHNNQIVKYKARLCAQGFTQVVGIDFEKTFSPTGQLHSLRTLIAFASTDNLQFNQINVCSAFLNAPLEEMVYISIPQGLDLDQQQQCLRLKRLFTVSSKPPLPGTFDSKNGWSQFVSPSELLIPVCSIEQTPTQLALYQYGQYSYLWKKHGKLQERNSLRV
ncbi:hypothetical protein O181_051535 [Austropuccinia psidii MF-1]|uniref:Reverse transcriptase Ty1/copia-type domain-containing protein n=1 Tax=Austropuccinia psidii MF-1 TaxID=1389203 RepID=A0A9Q3E382_9BASI|nr:hypothetical protein [Austropuccinia psidii MF-1]